MKVGDMVTVAPMWKYDVAVGYVTRIGTDGYVHVHWEGINGEWIYTPEQASRLKIINKNE